MMQFVEDTSFFKGDSENNVSNLTNDGRDSGKEHTDVHVYTSSRMMETPLSNGKTIQQVYSHAKYVQGKDKSVGSLCTENTDMLFEDGRGHMMSSPERGANTGGVAESRGEDILLSLLRMKDLVADHILQKRKNEKWYEDQIKQAKNYLKRKMESKINEDFIEIFPCVSEYNGYSQLLNAGLTFTHVNVVCGVMIHTFKCLHHDECIGEAYVLTGDKSLYKGILVKGHLCIAKKEPMLQQINSVAKVIRARQRGYSRLLRL